MIALTIRSLALLAAAFFALRWLLRRHRAATWDSHVGHALEACRATGPGLPDDGEWLSDEEWDGMDAIEACYALDGTDPYERQPKRRRMLWRAS